MHMCTHAPGGGEGVKQTNKQTKKEKKTKTPQLEDFLSVVTEQSVLNSQHLVEAAQRREEES